MPAASETSTPELGSLLFPGKVVDDHFKIVRLLGRGGMSEVYLARDLRLGRKVALKVVHPEGLGSKEALERFLFEARATAVFNHPHIITIYAVGADKGKPYVALEYLEGQSLRQRLDEDRLGQSEVLRSGLAIAEALREAHRNGILHRDLKPENVIIPRDGRLRVLDFGLAKAVAGSVLSETISDAAPQIGPTSDTLPITDGHRTQAGGMRGTPAYMAPEQWRDEPTGPSTDLWAFGVILHEMLAGRRPLAASTIASMAQKVTAPEPVPISLPADTPPELCALIARCLEKDPRARPAAAEAVSCLLALLQGGARAVVDERNPFRGLLPFTERHARFFFGRDDEVAAFLERLREEAVLPVVGPSGAGKSSFVQAGVLPRLREQGPWEVLRLRPGTRPFLALAARLLTGEGHSLGTGSLDSRDSGPIAPTRPQAEEELAAELRKTPSRLALRLQQLADQKRCRILLFVDQIEELYTHVEDEEVRRAFMEAVCTAADDAVEPVRVLFTLRDDFLGRLAETAAARQALSRLTVIRSPGPEALQQTVRCPVEAVGYAYDDLALVEEMVQAVKDEPAALPLLQFTTHLLWEHRDEQRKLLLRSTYDGIGGVAGALAEHADGVLQALTPVEVRCARELLLRLCTDLGTRRVLARDRALEGLGDDGARVLDRLVEARLLSVRRSQRDDRAEPDLELSHESLLKRWARLRRWFEEGRAELAMLAQVGQAAELWDRRGRRGEELWQGPALDEAERVLGRSGTSMPELTRRFLEAGRARARRRVLRLRAGVAGIIALLGLGVVVLAHQKSVADRERSQAQQRWAEAQLEGARAAEAQRQPLEARAKLRGSLETRDSALGRALWRRLSQDPLLWRRRLADSVTEVAFSPDGRTVAAACRDSSIYLFDAETVALRRVLPERDQVFSLAFSRDGRRLASGTRQGFLRLWDLQQGTVQATLHAHASSIWSLAVDPGGRRLASASDDGTVRTWELPGLAPRRELRGHAAGVYGVAFAPDGERLVSGSFDRTVRLWNEKSGALERELVDHESRIYEVAVDPRGRFLASAGADGRVAVYSFPELGPPRMLSGHLQRALSVSFSPDGELLATASADQTVRVWRVGSFDEVARLSGHTDWVRHVSFSPDGRRLASASPDKTVQVWDLAGGSSRAGPARHIDRVYAVAFSPDSTTLASAGADRTIRFWDSGSGRTRGSLAGHGDWVRCLAFSPDGKRLASGSSDASIRLWSTATSAAELVLLGHRSRVHSVQFSPGGDRLASAGGDGTIRLWDLSSEAAPKVLEGHKGAVKDARFSPDGKWLASGGEDGTVRLWDARGAHRVLRGHQETVNGVAFFPDGRRLASVSADRTMRIWELGDGAGRVLAREEDRLQTLAVSPDGRWVAVGGANGNLRLHDSRGEAKVTPLVGHRSEVNGVAFSGDGARLASASADGTVRVWDVERAMPAWRGPGLLGSPPRTVTQLGWIGFESDLPLSAKRAAWREAAIARALEISEAGDLLCLRAPGGSLEIWDRRADRRLFAEAVPGLEQVLALEGGCLSRGQGRLRLYSRWGSFRELPGEVTVAARSRQGILAATTARILELGPDGAVRASHQTGPGVRALREIGDQLIVGFENGTLTLIDRARPSARPRPLLRDAPSTAALQLHEGPLGTLVVGYANGQVAILDLRDGSRLDHVWVHGPVAALRVEGPLVYVLSELGDRALVDIGALQADACDVLRQVWQRVPVVWEGGEPVLRAAPTKHPCMGGL